MNQFYPRGTDNSWLISKNIWFSLRYWEMVIGLSFQRNMNTFSKGSQIFASGELKHSWSSNRFKILITLIKVYFFLWIHNHKITGSLLQSKWTFSIFHHHWIWSNFVKDEPFQSKKKNEQGIKFLVVRNFGARKNLSDSFDNFEVDQFFGSEKDQYNCILLLKPFHNLHTFEWTSQKPI